MKIFPGGTYRMLHRRTAINDVWTFFDFADHGPEDVIRVGHELNGGYLCTVLSVERYLDWPSAIVLLSDGRIGELRYLPKNLECFEELAK